LLAYLLGAIGLTSVLFATGGVRAVSMIGADGRDHLPTYEEAQAGTYPLRRSMVLACASAAPLVVKEFVPFAVSQSGQRIAGQLGAFPLNATAQRKSLDLIK